MTPCPQPSQGDHLDQAKLVTCPPWCQSNERHRYVHEFEVDRSTGHGIRSHEMWAGKHASVEVEERRDANGAVTFAAPKVYNEAYGADCTTSVGEVRAVAADLWVAASEAERLTLGAETPAPRSSTVDAIQGDSALPKPAQGALIAVYFLLCGA
jgi:hypothetical protein